MAVRMRQAVVFFVFWTGSASALAEVCDIAQRELLTAKILCIHSTSPLACATLQPIFAVTSREKQMAAALVGGAAIIDQHQTQRIREQQQIDAERTTLKARHWMPWRDLERDLDTYRKTQERLLRLVAEWHHRQDFDDPQYRRNTTFNNRGLNQLFREMRAKDPMDIPRSDNFYASQRGDLENALARQAKILESIDPRFREVAALHEQTLKFYKKAQTIRNHDPEMDRQARESLRTALEKWDGISYSDKDDVFVQQRAQQIDEELRMRHPGEAHDRSSVKYHMRQLWSEALREHHNLGGDRMRAFFTAQRYEAGLAETVIRGLKEAYQEHIIQIRALVKQMEISHPRLQGHSLPGARGPLVAGAAIGMALSASFSDSCDDQALGCAFNKMAQLSFAAMPPRLQDLLLDQSPKVCTEVKKFVQSFNHLFPPVQVSHVTCAAGEPSSVHMLVNGHAYYPQVIRSADNRLQVRSAFTPNTHWEPQTRSGELNSFTLGFSADQMQSYFLSSRNPSINLGFDISQNTVQALVEDGDAKRLSGQGVPTPEDRAWFQSLVPAQLRPQLAASVSEQMRALQIVYPALVYSCAKAHAGETSITTLSTE